VVVAVGDPDGHKLRSSRQRRGETAMQPSSRSGPMSTSLLFLSPTSDAGKLWQEAAEVREYDG
jgi:hypothetical protein